MTKSWLWLIGSLGLAHPWILLRVSGTHLEPYVEALAAGLGIFGAAFLLSWAAELAQSHELGRDADVDRRERGARPMPEA